MIPLFDVDSQYGTPMAPSRKLKSTSQDYILGFSILPVQAQREVSCPTAQQELQVLVLALRHIAL